MEGDKSNFINLTPDIAWYISASLYNNDLPANRGHFQDSQRQDVHRLVYAFSTLFWYVTVVTEPPDSA